MNCLGDASNINETFIINETIISSGGTFGTDIFVTGGTYNNATGTATFINNSGGTFYVTGFSTGGTGSSIFSITSATQSNNVLTFINSTGGTTTYTPNAATGGTYSNGTVTLLGSGTLSTITGLFTGNTEVLVTGGTYNNPTGTATFTNNTGGTFSITGFTTGGTSSTDVFVTGGTYSNGTAIYTNNTGGTFNVSGFLTGVTIPTDVFVTGGTYNNGIIILTNNTGGTVTINGLFTGTSNTLTGTSSVSAVTVTNNILSVTSNGSALTATTINAATGGTYSNGTITLIGSGTLSTITGLGVLSGATDVFTTGGTYNNPTGTATFTNNTGGTFNVTGFLTGVTIPTDVFVTGGTYTAGTAIFRNNTGGTFSVTGFTTGGTQDLSGYLPLSGAAYTTTSGQGLRLSSTTLTSGSLVDLTAFGTGAASNTYRVLNIATSGANPVNQTTYCAFFSNTHTGTNAINIGLYATAASGTTNLAARFDAGLLMGATTPYISFQLGTGAAGDYYIGRSSTALSMNSVGSGVLSLSGVDYISYLSGIVRLGTTGVANVLIGHNVNGNARVDVQNAASAAIVGRTTIQARTTSNTYSTTANTISAYGAHILQTATRSSGANDLTNVGLFVSASGAQRNYAAIFEAGDTGFGTLLPDAKVHIAGTFKLVDGSEGLNKVLTSDANGLASWQTPTGSSSSVLITGGTPNNAGSLYTFTNNTGGTFNVLGLTDIRVTGGTYSNGSATFTNNTGGTFSVSGFSTGTTQDLSGYLPLSGGTLTSGLTITSTTSALRPPIMTEAQRLALPLLLSSIVYQSDNDEGLYIYKSTGWVQIG